MIIVDEIQEKNFKYCPNCGYEVKKTRTLADTNNSDMLLCINCHSRYYLGLAPEPC